MNSNVQTNSYKYRRNTHFFDKLESTNDYAEWLIETKHPEEFTTIVAGYQTRGKGTGDNTWDSEPGKNLLVSVILNPDFLPAEKQFSLNIPVCLAILKLLREFLPDEPVKIKWPNDLYVGQRKIGGVLIKNLLAGNQILNSIIGIGLNINQLIFRDNLPNPVSIHMLTGATYDLEAILDHLLEKLKVEYTRLMTGVFEIQYQEYISNLLNYNMEAKYQAGDRVLWGKISGITEFGKLILDTNIGRMEFDFKEIVFIFDEPNTCL